VSATLSVSLVVPVYNNQEPVGSVQLNTYYYLHPNILALHAGGALPPQPQRNRPMALILKTLYSLPQPLSVEAELGITSS
jgi:hypothetical protein